MRRFQHAVGFGHCDRTARTLVHGLQLFAVREVDVGAVGRVLPAIEAAIGALRPEYRTCILLRHVEGRAYEEIAEILNLPLGTVKTYIHRARQELREYLGDLK